MPLSPGSQLGPYTIVGAIGAGGMGEVYRGRDTKLDRDVAIKVLPSELAKDPDRLARFAREAKLLASLNHPNIAHVYGFESATLTDGSTAHFLAMELVESADVSTVTRRIASTTSPTHVSRSTRYCAVARRRRRLLISDLRPGSISLVIPAIRLGISQTYV